MTEHEPCYTSGDITSKAGDRTVIPKSIEELGTSTESSPRDDVREDPWSSHMAKWVSSTKDGTLTDIATAERELFRYYEKAYQQGIAEDLQPTLRTVNAAMRALSSEPRLETVRGPVQEGGLELEIVIAPEYTEEQLAALETLDLKDFLDDQEATAQVFFDGERVGEVQIHFGLRESRATVQLPRSVTAKDQLYIRVVNNRRGIIALARVGGSDCDALGHIAHNPNNPNFKE